MPHMLVYCLIQDWKAGKKHKLKKNMEDEALFHSFSEYNEKSFSFHGHSKEVNKLLLGLQLPHFVKQTPLPVDKTAFMKARLLRNFFDYHVDHYGLSCHD